MVPGFEKFFHLSGGKAATSPLGEVLGAAQ